MPRGHSTKPRFLTCCRTLAQCQSGRLAFPWRATTTGFGRNAPRGTETTAGPKPGTKSGTSEASPASSFDGLSFDSPQRLSPNAVANGPTSKPGKVGTPDVGKHHCGQGDAAAGANARVALSGDGGAGGGASG